MNLKPVARLIFGALFAGLSYGAIAAISATDDSYEENDTLSTAYDHSFGELTTINGVSWDLDWYKIYVTPGFNRVQIDLQHLHADADLDLFLTDSLGNYLDSSESVTNNEYIEFDVDPAGGTYYIYVDVWGSYNGATYTLWWDDIQPPSATGDDNYEVNNTASTAYDHTLNEMIWLSGLSGLGISNDEDWYKIEVTPGYTQVQIDATFSSASADIDIELYDSTGTILLASSYYGTDSESIDYDVGAGGFYLIKVTTYGGYVGATYDMYWDDVMPAVAPPTDDLYEENDVRSSAYNLASNKLTWLSALSGEGVSNDDDWYAINVVSGETEVQVEATFLHASADINIHLYDAVGTLLASSTSFTDNEVISFDVGAAGTYYIKVDTNAGNFNGTNYDLRWNAVAVPTGDDSYESNNTPATAYNLGANEATLLSNLLGLAISNDADWYLIDVTPGYTRVQINATFSHTSADINIELYDATGTTVLASSNSTTDNESIDYDVGTGGAYLIKVTTLVGSSTGTTKGGASAGTSNYNGSSYDLWWDDITPSSPAPSGGGGGGGMLSLPMLISSLGLLGLLRRFGQRKAAA
ncbi:MAG: pre-peptidase C-terminal domain-containing protein [Gammaproteobacteria bacterium]|nr:pre-peptidase C-terminal domain-containing protein [Gammaproteobacteria bacterium]